jgi:hypothetical protein
MEVRGISKERKEFKDRENADTIIRFSLYYPVFYVEFRVVMLGRSSIKI